MKSTIQILVVSCLLVASVPARDEARHDVAEHVVTVSLPDAYDDAARYPVLYVLDGESNLEHASVVASFLADVGAIPELIVVGVHAGATRAVDYLPAGGEPGGEAARFLDVLVDRIVSFVDERYATAPLRLLSGHSYGGVFVTHAMAARPDAFAGYFAQSPYLDVGVGDALVDHVSDRAAEGELSDAHYHATLGDEPALSANYERLGAVLSDAGAEAVLARDASESHMTTRLLGLYAALEQFFAETWPWSPASGTDLVDHVDGLSDRYGYPVRYSASAFQLAVQQKLSGGAPDEALDVARVYVDHHPRSVLAHYLLGSARASTGDAPGAVAAFDDALALFEAAPRPDLVPIRDAMRQMRTALSRR